MSTSVLGKPSGPSGPSGLVSTWVVVLVLVLVQNKLHAVTDTDRGLFWYTVPPLATRLDPRTLLRASALAGSEGMRWGRQAI